MSDGHNLLPCPFCGAGTFEVHENGKVWTGQRYSEPVSIEVRHWCAPIAGQPMLRMLAFVGRDAESAVAAWNRRAFGL